MLQAWRRGSLSLLVRDSRRGLPKCRRSRRVDRFSACRLLRKAAERIVLALSGEDVCADIVGESSLEILGDGQANGTNGFPFLTVLQPRATRLGVGLGPFQADHLA